MASLEGLFDLYSADLSRFEPDLAGKFRCPVCFSVIPRSEPLRAVVAEEHVFSEALGGRLTTLTCRPCNNDKGGSELESHLVQRVLVEARKRPLRVRYQMRESVMRGEMPLPASGTAPIEMKVVGKQSDPRRVAEIQELLKGLQDDIHLHLDFGYSERRTLVAVLRSAYLMMFRTFGYAYALDASATLVREQILDHTRDLGVLDGIAWRLGPPVPSDTMLTLMLEPEELRSFVVLLRLDEDTQHFAGVSLPLPGSTGEDLYARIREHRASGLKGTVRVTPVPQVHGFRPFPSRRRQV